MFLATCDKEDGAPAQAANEPERSAAKRQLRTISGLLFLLFLGTFAYFNHSEPGWNVSSRLALTFAIVEKGTVEISDYWQRPDMQTKDVAVYEGRVYSDKIIGTSLAGVPAFAAIRLLELLSGEPLPTPARRYYVTLLSVGLLAAFSGVLLFRLLLILPWPLPGNPNGRAPLPLMGAMVISVVILFGTLLLYYSTLYMSYLPAQFFFLWSLYRFERWRMESPQAEAGAVKPAPPLFSCGLLLGFALLCEYTVGILALFYGLYVLISVPRRLPLWRFAAGTILGLAPFLLYTYSIFGRLAIPYQYEHYSLFREFMSRGVMGASWPRLSVLWLITFHPYRGVFFHSPFLLVALAGLIVMLRWAPLRRLGLMVAAVLISYLLFNSGYYMWWGGWAVGPRHLAPTLALLALPLMAAWHYQAGRWSILILAIPAVGLHLLVNAYNPQFQDLNALTPLEHLLFPSLEYEYPWVVSHYIWPLFWQEGLTVRNPGTLLGLSGPASLLPLMGFWALVGGALLYLIRNASRRACATQQDGSCVS